MKIGHLFLSIFEIKKKVLKTKKLSVFSISPIYSVKWRAKWLYIRRLKEKKPMTYQKILRNRQFHIFLQESRIRGIF